MTKKLIALFIALVMLATPFTFFVNADDTNLFAIRITEEESNNTFATAQTIYSDYTVSGSFASQSDVDIYKITSTIDGLANFHLGNIPVDNDYDLELYDSNYELLAVGTASYDFEQIMAQSVSVGDVFYILVRCFQMYDSQNSDYSLRTRLYPLSYTYYTQSNGKQPDIENNLDKLYNSSVAYNANGDIEYWSTQHWNIITMNTPVLLVVMQCYFPTSMLKPLYQFHMYPRRQMA